MIQKVGLQKPRPHSNLLSKGFGVQGFRDLGLRGLGV